MDACNQKCLTTNTLNFLTPKEISCFSEYFPSFKLGAQTDSAEPDFIHMTVSHHRKALPSQESEKYLSSFLINLFIFFILNSYYFKKFDLKSLKIFKYRLIKYDKKGNYTFKGKKL
jgi:hypothetical protein